MTAPDSTTKEVDMKEIVKGIVKSSSMRAGAVRLRRPPRPDFLKLKAERVQEMLRSMPGWKLSEGGTSIHRLRLFPSARTAAAYASYVAQFAGSPRQTACVLLAGRQVGLTLMGAPRPRGVFGGLTLAVLAFARKLG
jgi:hypothetical protein